MVPGRTDRVARGTRFNRVLPQHAVGGARGAGCGLLLTSPIRSEPRSSLCPDLLRQVSLEGDRLLDVKGLEIAHTGIGFEPMQCLGDHVDRSFTVALCLPEIGEIA